MFKLVIDWSFTFLLITLLILSNTVVNINSTAMCWICFSLGIALMSSGYSTVFYLQYWQACRDQEIRIKKAQLDRLLEK